jgi:hypothetical protein
MCTRKNISWCHACTGEVAFIAEGPDKTTVMFKLEHQLPWILVDMKVSRQPFIAAGWLVHPLMDAP